MSEICAMPQSLMWPDLHRPVLFFLVFSHIFLKIRISSVNSFNNYDDSIVSTTSDETRNFEVVIRGIPNYIHFKIQHL